MILSPLAKMGVLGSCPECKVGYLVNVLDGFTAQYAIPVWACNRCRYKAIRENSQFTKAYFKEKQKT